MRTRRCSTRETSVSSPLPVDARGFARTLGANPDIGAYEAALNQAPAVAAPSPVVVAEDAATVVTGISFSDADAGSGVTVLGDGTEALSLLGSIADINAFLAASKLTFTPAANATGNVTLGIAIGDGGHEGSGAPRSRPAARSLPSARSTMRLRSARGRTWR
jgi:hypothetical protein